MEMSDDKRAATIRKEIEAFERLTKCKESLEPALAAFIIMLETKVQEAVAKQQVM